MTLNNIKHDNVKFISIAEGGAMGYAGRIELLSIINNKCTLYIGNMFYGEKLINMNEFYQIFPEFKTTSCFMGRCNNLPKGWQYVNLGMGNNLFVSDDVYDYFVSIVDISHMSIYKSWLEKANATLMLLAKGYKDKEIFIEKYNEGILTHEEIQPNTVDINKSDYSDLKENILEDINQNYSDKTLNVNSTENNKFKILGAIIGDTIGSRFEYRNLKSKKFKLFDPDWSFTDDSVMTIAIFQALLCSKTDYSDLSEQTVKSMQTLARKYPDRGYGGMFANWIWSEDPQPYNSFGNGSAMRVSGCGYVANSIEEAKILSKYVTEVTHNHPEGIKGAEAVAVAIFLARQGKTLTEIQDYINQNYYPISFTIDEIRENYDYDVTCQGCMPQAFQAFFESTSFEDAIRNAISIGGDSDTIGAITGSIASAYYGIPKGIINRTLEYLDEDLSKIVFDFENRYNENINDNLQISAIGSEKSLKTDNNITILVKQIKNLAQRGWDKANRENDFFNDDNYLKIIEKAEYLLNEIKN